MKVCKDALLQEECWTKKLESGMEVITFPKKDYLQKGAYLLIGYGGAYRYFLDEEGKSVELPEGTAHFLEHKLFENQEVDVFEEMSFLGAAVNAFTSQHSTCYYFTTADNFQSCLELLLKIPMMKGYTEKGIKEEVPIISREIDMHLDDDGYYAYAKAMDMLYPVHPIGRDIAGTKESIGEISKELLDKVMDSYYVPSNMSLLLVGDFSKEQVEELCQKLPSFYQKESTGAKTFFPVDKEIPKKTFLHKERDTVASFTYMVKGEPISDPKEAFAKYLSYRIVLEAAFGDSGEFYQKGYDNRWFLDLSTQVSYGEGYFYYLISGESTNPLLLKKELENYLEELSQKGIKEEDFQRIRNSYTGQFLVSFNSVRSIALQYIFLHQQGIHHFDYLKILEELTPKKLDEINRDKAVFSVVGRIDNESGSI